MELMEVQPHVVFHVLDKAHEKQIPTSPKPSSTSPNWCTCGNCREMPTENERKCCEKLPQNCWSTLHMMDTVVLDRQVLEVARRNRNDWLGEDDRIIDINRSLRHTAYRQWVTWKYGKLGQSDRRVIPSCIVWRIHQTYPDPLGQYTGFRPARLT